MLALIGFVMVGCKEENEAKVESSTAVTLKVVAEIDGKAYSQNGAGYIFDDNYSLVKAESSTQQLSIDFYGRRLGNFVVINAARATGNAKLTFYADITNTKIAYVSKSGTFNVTKYESVTGGGVNASGTFSATLEKFNNNVSTGETIEVKNGSFTDIYLRDLR